MKWASAISDQQLLAKAIEECTAKVAKDLGDAKPDLAVAFVSPHFRAEYDQVPELVRDSLGPVCVLGCSGGGIIGNGLEIEQRPAVSVTAANLPDVAVTEFHLGSSNLPDLDAGPQSWEKMVKVEASQEPQFVIVADPFSFQAQNLLMGLDFAFTKSAKIGGLASGGQQPGENALFLGKGMYQSGAVGVALHGNIVLDTVVAQGCRPIGDTLRVTQCRRNLLIEADGQPPLAVLKSLFQQLNDRDRGLMRDSLFLGWLWTT